MADLDTCVDCGQTFQSDDDAVVVSRDALELHEGMATIVAERRYAHRGHEAESLDTGFDRVAEGTYVALKAARRI